MKLIVIDTSVLLYQIASVIDYRYGESVAESDEAAVYADAAIRFIDQLGWLPALHNQRCKVIWAQDSKPYWRLLLYPKYKGDRKEKPKGFDVAAEAFKRSSVAKIEFDGQEADDIAAAIVRLWLQSTNQIVNQIYLATVDSDWYGLILHPEIYWCHTRNGEPRLRGRTEIYNWLCGKWAKQSKKKQRAWALPSFSSFSCSHIWDWKVATGDTADKLEANSARHLINLLYPPRIYDLCDQPESVAKIHRSIYGAEPVKAYGWREAQGLIFALGLTLPIDTLFVPADIANRHLVA